MIKAKIKTTGQKIIVRPYSHEFYDFICCNEDGSMQGTLLRRDELEIIGDNQEDPPAVVTTYWAARDKCGDCFLYESEPMECIDGVWQVNQCKFYSISPGLLPEVTHANSPMKVELVIKK